MVQPLSAMSRGAGGTENISIWKLEPSLVIVKVGYLKMAMVC